MLREEAEEARYSGDIEKWSCTQKTERRSLVLNGPGQEALYSGKREKGHCDQATGR